mgnify:FL=1
MLFRSGELKVVGRLVDASNATLYAEIVRGTTTDENPKVIYKPIAGERPLWDFPEGTLANREYAAYLLSKEAGFDLVPKTVLRDGPFGKGMVQEWIDTDEETDVVSFGQSDDSSLRKMALFDAIINNTDRKFGHLLITTGKQVFGCDHGVTFHEEDKLRTVLWQFAGEKFNQTEIQLLKASLQVVSSPEFLELLSEREVAATSKRINSLLSLNEFPLPNPNWPAVPWPPV